MHPILKFIKENLDDSFSSSMVWESVKDHDHQNGFELYLFACTPCQSTVYPCPRVREVASYFSDREGFDESWTNDPKQGKVEPW